MQVPSLREMGHDVTGALETVRVPSYVIDRHGIVRYAKAGSFSEAEFDAVILPLLHEPAG